MNRTEAWVGKCYLREPVANGTDNSENEELNENSANIADYECYAALWTNSSKDFDDRLRTHIEESGKLLLWTEEIQPINNWLHRHGHHQQVMALAKSVHASHRIRLGKLSALNIREDGLAEATNAIEEEQDYLVVDEIEDIEPLDGQYETWPRKNVPETLLAPLFGQPEPTEAEIHQYGSVGAVPQMKTYAIIDAAKVMHGLTVISDCDTPYRCLFKGKAAEELKNVAPYLIELDVDTKFTRTLFTYHPKFPNNQSTIHLWHKEPGIFIRTRFSFNVIYNHLRKFTMIHDGNGKSYYFRFWEPSVLRKLPEILDRKTGERLFLNDTQFIAICSSSKTCGIIQRAQ